MMKLSFSCCSQNTLTLMRQVGREAEAKGLKAYAVGGFVRDLILKRKSLDLDIVVVGDGASVFAKHFARTIGAGVITYQQFATATVFLPGGFQFDVVAARKESYPFSGSLPVVEPGSVFDDLFRRDFTVNAMALAINPGVFGELVDYFDGFKDLKNKEIRILHPKSFVDDPTRILRAVRFEQRLGFNIESETLKLLKKALKENVVSHVKPQRYFEDFKKILSEDDPVKCVKRLHFFKGLGFLNQNLWLDKNTWALFKKAKRQISWFRKRFEENKDIDQWLVYLIILTIKLSSGKARQLAEHFNLRKEDREKVALSPAVGEILGKLSQKDLSAYNIYKILQPLGYEAILVCRINAKQKKVRQRIDKFLFEYETAKPYLKGRDLIRLGVAPGRAIGVILEKILQARIDGEIKTRLDEVNLAKSLKGRIGRLT